MTRGQAREKDRGNVIVKNNFHPAWGNECFVVYGEESHFAYAFFHGQNALNDAEQYADEEYNKWSDDGRYVG